MMTRRRVRRLVVAAVLVLGLGIGWLVVSRVQPVWYLRVLYPLNERTVIRREAARQHLDPTLIAAVISQESGWVPDSRSQPGAVGLMQVLPSTARFIASQPNRPSPPPTRLEDPAVNIAYGTWYLRYLIDRYGSVDAALAAYNAGETNLVRWIAAARAAGHPFRVLDDVPFPETRSFVRGVEHDIGVYRKAYGGELLGP